LVVFWLDRINVGRKARVKAVSPLKAKDMVKQHLADVEQRLNQDFLFGQQPTHADFSTYHSLWFIHDLAESPLLQGSSARVGMDGTHESFWSWHKPTN
jgi:glutathione S-transferase